MNKARWILFTPVTLISAVIVYYIILNYKHSYYYSNSGILLSFIGLFPLFISKYIPILITILIGVAIAPNNKNNVNICLCFLCIAFGWPYGNKYYTNKHINVFYLTALFGVLSGVISGYILARWLIFRAQAKTRQAKPEDVTSWPK